MKFNIVDLLRKEMMFCIIILLSSFFAESLQAKQLVPQRVITLSPHLAELVYSLGSGASLAGVIEHSDYPESVKNIPLIGSASGLDLERILSIKPDLIIAWQGGTRETDIKKLENLGLRVVSIDSESLDDIPESIKKLGDLLNRQQRSLAMIDAYYKHLKAITKKYSKQPVHRVFIEISSQPLMGLTNHHPFATGLELCGLKNIFSDFKKAAIITDLESILSRDAGLVLLRQSPGSNEFSAREEFYRINNRNVVSFLSFDEDTAFRQTPRMLDALEAVCRAASGLK